MAHVRRIRLAALVVVAAVLLLVSSGCLASDDTITPLTREFDKPHHEVHGYQSHHSFGPPFDPRIMSWDFGGSTVITRKFARITPATQGRTGWMWNAYPIEFENFDIQIEFQVSSENHLGGDGFAFWITRTRQQAGVNLNRPEEYTGVLFGHSLEFDGLGICFDTYDNDGRRDNPAIFAIESDGKKPLIDGHDDDFRHVMLPNAKCRADYRNLEKPAKVRILLFKKQLSVLHNIGGKREWVQCFHAEVQHESFEDFYLGVTGMTGDVADRQDVIRISTRVIELDEKLEDLEKEKLEWEPSSSHWLSSFFWLSAVLSSIALCLNTAFDMMTLGEIKENRNPVYIAQKLSSLVPVHFIVHITLTALFFLSFNWMCFLLNAPLAGFRVYTVVKGGRKALNYDPNNLGSLFKMFALRLAFYLVTTCLYLSRFASDL